MRTKFFAAVPTWFAQMDTPIGFTTVVVQWIAITSERREVTAVSAARATPAMGL